MNYTIRENSFSTRKPKKNLLDAEKQKIFQSLEAGESRSSLTKEYNVSVSPVRKIKKRITRLPDQEEKRIREGTGQIEQALLQWLKLQANQGISISNNMFKERAQFFAGQFNVPDFNCSLSWIWRFKVRNNIVTGFHKVTCECSLPDQMNAGCEFLNIRAQYTNDQIFISDEFPLLFSSKMDEKYKFTVEENTSKNKNLEQKQFTVMATANTCGTAVKKLLIVGKYYKRDMPSVDYFRTKNTSITSYIFTKWLRAWDQELTKKKEKILLLLANSVTYCHTSVMKSIKIYYMTFDEFRTLQPHPGIIQVLKENFFKIMNDDNAEGLNNSLQDDYSYLKIADAWSKVTTDIINGCYTYNCAGLTHNKVACGSEDFENKNDVTFLHLSTEAKTQIKYEPDHTMTFDEMFTDNIIKDVKDEPQDALEDVDIKAISKNLCSTPTNHEALKAAETLSMFINTNFEDNNVKQMMSHLHNAVHEFVNSKN